jgi:hypothetical protein
VSAEKSAYLEAAQMKTFLVNRVCCRSVSERLESRKAQPKLSEISEQSQLDNKDREAMERLISLKTRADRRLFRCACRATEKLKVRTAFLAPF